MKLDVYFSKSCQENSNVVRITGILHEDLCAFMIISRSVLLRMRNVSDIFCRENQNKCFAQKSFPKIVPLMRKSRKMM